MLNLNSRWSIGGACAVTALLLSPIVAFGARDDGSWTVVSSPSPNPANLLSSVATLRGHDAWAVGATGTISQFPPSFQTLTEHWDGTSWSVVPSPSPGTSSSLSSVAAFTRRDQRDLWAVGSSDSGTLIERWDGSSWTVVPSPSPGTASSLAGVGAISPRDAWAVGGSTLGTLVEHWDGSTWSVVPTPATGTLSGVAALSPTDAWAVGTASAKTLVEHWDGASWSVVPSPNAGTFSNLTSVAANSPNDVWAVGGSFAQGAASTLVEHWDGSSWTVVPSPSPGSLTALLGVTSVSDRNVWAVGDANTNSAVPFVPQPLVEHWDGTSWSVVPSASRDSGGFLAGVDFKSPGRGWAVGSSTELATRTNFTLVERFSREDEGD